MIKIAICDDEKESLNELYIKISELFENEDFKIDIQIDLYSDSKAFMDILMDNIEYDILFLDIEMPGVNGLKIAEYIYNKRYNTKIVYVSHHEKYIIETFGYNFIWFLPKNVIDRDLPKVIKKIKEIIKIDELKYEFKSERTIVKVSLKDIYYFEINTDQKNHINLITDKQKYPMRKPLREVEEIMLNEFFVRSHSSYLINIRHISKFNANSIILDNGEKIPMSKNNKKEVLNKYKEYLRGL